MNLFSDKAGIDKGGYPKRGEIWTCDLTGALGTEMGAKVGDDGDEEPWRRCVVVSRNEFNSDGSLTVVPLQTNPDYERYKGQGQEDSTIHERIDSSFTSWASRARWAASLLPDKGEVRENCQRTGRPYQYGFGARQQGTWDEDSWNPSIADCGQLWRVTYAPSDSPDNQLYWNGPTAKLTDIAQINVDTALHALIAPWSRLPPDNIPHQGGEIIRMEFLGTGRLWLVVSCPAIDYLRENMWVHRREPRKRRRFSVITVVPLELNPDQRPDRDDPVVEVTFDEATRALVYCHHVRTLDWRSRSWSRTDFRISPGQLMAVGQTLRSYLGLPPLPTTTRDEQT